MRANEFYCVKCKGHVMLDSKGIKMKTLKNGRPAMTGKCTHCDTKVFKFVKMSGVKKSRKRSTKRSRRSRN